jgi:chloramphenicol 3-O-phosphotransferase
MMNLMMNLFMNQLLNESQQLRKKFAWSLQTSTLKYRVKKAMSIAKNAMSEALMKAFIVIIRVLQNDENIALMFIIIWLKNIKVAWSLIDNESVIEINN